MKGSEHNFLQSLVDYRRTSIELLPSEAPSKLTTSQLKLRQLIQKTPMNSINTYSPSDTFQQISSKQALEATRCEKYSQMSCFSDSSQLLLSKQKNLSPKHSSKANAKLPAKNSFFGSQPHYEENHLKALQNKGKGKPPSGVANLSLANSPKNGNVDFNLTDFNCVKTTKDSDFDPQNYMNFLLSQPKTSQNQVKKSIKLHSYFLDEDDDDKNLSLDDKIKSSASNSQFKKSSNYKNVSQDSQSITPSSKHESKDYENLKEGVKPSKNRLKMIQHELFAEAKKNEGRKNDTLKYGIVNTPTNTNTNPTSGTNATKKRHLHIDSVMFDQAERNRRDTIEKVFVKKRQAITPDTLTSRETEPTIPFEAKKRRMTPKPTPAYNDLVGSSKDAIYGPKDTRMDIKKKLSANSKGSRYKPNSKGPAKKDSNFENGLEDRASNGRREGSSSGYLMLAGVKGTSPNGLSSTISNTACSSTKNQKKSGDSQYAQVIGGELDMNDPSMIEITLNGVHDAVVHAKDLNRKDSLLEEDGRKTVKGKRLLRAKSHGDSAHIEEVLNDMMKNEKAGKEETKQKARVFSLKQNTKEKKQLKSPEGKEIQKNVAVEQEGVGKKTKKEMSSCSVPKNNEIEVNPKELQEKNQNVNDSKVAALVQVLERTNKVLSVYKEREKVWQSERKDLLNQINRLKEKEKENIQ